VVVMVIFPAPEIARSPVMINLSGRSTVRLGDSSGMPRMVRSPLILYVSTAGAATPAAR